MRKAEGPLSGRRREAARNDIEILAAAREVFLADPSAPISAVADRAKVGISALYRRYASKDDLLRELARDGLLRYIAELDRALADDRDPCDRLHRLPDPESSTAEARPWPSAWPGLHPHPRPVRAGPAGRNTGRGRP